MRISILRIGIFTAALLALSAYALSTAKPQGIPESITRTIPAADNLRSFEFLGCSGGWTDEKIQPQAWRASRTGKTTFLVRHAADCGYTIGSSPKAAVIGSSIDFSYLMSNDGGMVAACYCEYWASFELKSAPETITKISINGAEAKLMSGLSEH